MALLALEAGKFPTLVQHADNLETKAVGLVRMWVKMKPGIGPQVEMSMFPFTFTRPYAILGLPFFGPTATIWRCYRPKLVLVAWE